MSVTEQDVATLYEQYGGMVHRRCQAILKNEHQAMDALQDVFVQLLKRRQTLKTIGLSSLLYRMATNVCLNMLRHQSVRDDYQTQTKAYLQSTESDQTSTESAIINLDRILKRLSRFPERTQEVALYYFADGFTMEEIANMMHMSQSNTRRILRELKSVVASLEGVE